VAGRTLLTKAGLRRFRERLTASTGFDQPLFFFRRPLFLLRATSSHGCFCKSAPPPSVLPRQAGRTESRFFFSNFQSPPTPATIWRWLSFFTQSTPLIFSFQIPSSPRSGPLLGLHPASSPTGDYPLGPPPFEDLFEPTKCTSKYLFKIFSLIFLLGGSLHLVLRLRRS